MRQHFHSFLLASLVMLTLASAALSEAATPAKIPKPEELAGEWRVMLENANSRKLIHFRVLVKDGGRLRGKVISKDAGSHDLDGRVEADGKILFWSTYYTREGASVESSFKGALDESGAIVGESRFFNKPYTFRAEHSDK